MPPASSQARELSQAAPLGRVALQLCTGRRSRRWRQPNVVLPMICCSPQIFLRLHLGTALVLLSIVSPASAQQPDASVARLPQSADYAPAPGSLEEPLIDEQDS